VLPAQLYLVGQQCPDSWGCFVEANTLTWSLGSMTAGNSSSFNLNLAIAGTCPSSGCPPLVGVADTPSLDNLNSGYSSFNGAASEAVPAGLRGLPSQLWRAI
jgi:hypothetical protein